MASWPADEVRCLRASSRSASWSTEARRCPRRLCSRSGSLFQSPRSCALLRRASSSSGVSKSSSCDTESRITERPRRRPRDVKQRERSESCARSTTSRPGAGPEGESDETIQFAQIERLVQITDGPRDQRVGLLGVPAATHHEDRRVHAEVADALEQVEALLPGPAGACLWHDHVQQNEVEPLT